MIEVDGLRRQLNKAGLRVTPQRIAILRTICQSKAHPTAAMVYEEIRKRHPNIALGTIYYTLERLVDSGIVTTIGAVGDDQVHYDGDTTFHSHLACLSCQKIIDIQSPDLEGMTDSIRSDTGFKVLGSCFVYYGLCPDCQRKIKASENK